VANVLGVRIDASTLDEAVSQIGTWISEGKRTYIAICTVNNVVQALRSENYRQVLNGSGLTTSDGVPLVWELHRQGHAGAERVYGPDLFLAVSNASISRGWKHFYYGGHEGVAESLAAKMRGRFPGLRVVGMFSPPVASVDELCTQEVADDINASDADIVWVGLGAPKQEEWMARMRERLAAPILIGVGAAFDIHTGRVAQAPLWMQRNGLEWLFRLGSEPARLWRRYLVGNTRFVWELTLQRLGVKKFLI
jgi:N-acetylglucosaminyldiphosphoundecaprenol N-acetyl-beta-D-mannosaminyltransferase